MMPLTTIVATIAKIAAGDRLAASCAEPGSSFSIDSFKICMKEMIIMIEKTRIPIGSRRLRPTGNFFFSRVSLQPTSLLVVHIISVQSRSSAESTSDAMRERELDFNAAMLLATRRKMLTMTLIC